MPGLTRTLIVNGDRAVVSVDDDREQLLYVLRNQLDQHGPKFGCGVAQCGSCTVLIDGAIRRSCVTPINTVPDGAAVRTLDGIGTVEAPHPLQKAFVEEQAAQCAFCINGMVMGSLGWLESRIASGNREVPKKEEIADFLSGALPESTFNYLCRCGAHVRILEAIRNAAKEMIGD